MAFKPNPPKYEDVNETAAYHLGYATGFLGLFMRSFHSFPNAYARGYHEGVYDAVQGEDDPHGRQG